MENDQLLKMPMQAFVTMWEVILNFLEYLFYYTNRILNGGIEWNVFQR